ncbi:MAG: CRISPR-associated endoribonuclease Cas6 [Clostridium lundense]|nr:CRISPR-associated endoribonuclease Cas6 [Clostridium lundense]
MRLRCEYKTERIPLAYQMMFVSLIKESLKKTDKEYFEKLYKFDKDKANKSPKNFCFSVFMKGFEKQEDEFLIKDKVIFNVSSPDYEFMINLYNGILKFKEFNYKNKYFINKVRIDLVKEKSISSNIIEFNTLSPLCIKDRNNDPIEMNDEKFQRELNYICNKSLEAYRGYGLGMPIVFTDRGMRKRVVKEDITAFRNNTNKPYYYVNSYAGGFTLQGDIKDLNDLYKLGIGFKRGQGFGMIEIVG